MVKASKTRVMISIPKDLYEKAKVYCSRYDKSFSQLLIDLLHKELDR